MPSTNQTIAIPLNDLKHLFIDPNCDPFIERHLTVSGLEHAIKQLRTKPLPEKIQLHLILPKGSEIPDVANLKKVLKRHCLTIVKEQEEDSLYLSWQIKSNFKRALLPLLMLIVVVGSMMYHMMDERSRFIQILLVLLNNCVIILGWVLLWVPAEMYLYEAPRLKREIALYRLLADADITLAQDLSSE